jgi:putative nucleotidyltransferase with HDIG domain
MSLVTQNRVIASSDELPAFPDVVLKIQNTLDDPDAGLHHLSEAVEMDPVTAALVLSLANRAANSRGGKPVSSVFNAISLVGVSKVRELTTMISLASFVKGWGGDENLRACWAHSLSVAVCSIEVALYTPTPVCMDTALVAGLLHDVGRLWLYRFEMDKYSELANMASEQGLDSEELERLNFGVDHGIIGGWLAHRWQLPSDLVNAIAHHGDPTQGNGNILADVVHVGEVLCNSLELNDRPRARVVSICPVSCTKLGLDWGPDTQRLLGRIDARSRHTHALFDSV